MALVTDLVDLHEKYGKALYEKNIRTFLGHKTEVNSAIQKTLADQPESFLYLNNGVTALCEIVDQNCVTVGNNYRDALFIR